jgi:hypothetical protein
MMNPGREHIMKTRFTGKKVFLLAIGCLILVPVGAVLSGCNRTRIPTNTNDYVEIDNPILSGNPAENAKIWVPKSSLAQGAPRGGELVKRGYDNLTNAPKESSAGKPAADADTVRQRLFVATEGKSPLDRTVSELLRNRFVVRPAGTGGDPAGTSPGERLALAARLAKEPGGGLLLLLAAPESVRVGDTIKAELYDGRGPLLLRTFTVKVPPAEVDESSEESAKRAVYGLVGAVSDLVGRLPWFGRVISVSGERVYFDAGTESGLKAGQKLSVSRGGETVKGVGFAPGERIASVTLTGFVGPDGSYGTTADAGRIQPGDFIELEK